MAPRLGQQPPDETVNSLVDFALDLDFEQIDHDTVDRTKRLIVDTVGCGLGGSQSPPARVALRLASHVPVDAPATIMTTGQTTTPDLAAFVNGVMIRYLDFNDTFIGMGGGGHPSDLLAPALAAAEYSGRSGADLLVGLVAGYEIYCALGDTEQQLPLWDQSTYALIAASVMTSKLMGLDRRQTIHALSLSVASHLSIGQIRVGQISHWKACAVPNAARNAIFCGLLAGDGMTGPDLVFDGERGFKAATGWDFTLPTLNDPTAGFRINRTSMKKYPAGYFSQSAIEAALAARSLISDLSDVRSIQLETFPSGYRAMGSDPSRWRPQTRETADHSLPFVVALALLHGDVRLEHYENELYKSQDVLGVMDLVTVSVGDESTAAWPDEPLSILHVDMHDGRRVTTRNGKHPGHHSKSMTDAEQGEKFRALARDLAGLPAAQVDRLLEVLRSLDKVPDIGELMRASVPGSVSNGQTTSA